MSDKKVDNKRSFTVEVDGKKLNLAVVRPTQKDNQAAQLAYNRAFRQAVKPDNGEKGALVRAALDGILREQKLWDDEREKTYQELSKALLEGEKKLTEGGIKLKEARAIAIKMRGDRWSLRELRAERDAMDVVTADAQAENARFNYLVSVCTRTEEGKPYFKSEEDYLNRADDEISIAAASNLGKLIYGLDDNWQHKLPENKFLLKYHLARPSDLHLINEQGKPVNPDGHLVDDKGRLINEQGQIVDSEGNLLEEDGSYKVDFKPFLAEDGSDIPVPSDETTTPAPATV